MLMIINFSLSLPVPARIVNISEDKSVNEGDDVNLFCLAVGRPEPTVTWKDFKCELPPCFWLCTVLSIPYPSGFQK